MSTKIVKAHQTKGQAKKGAPLINEQTYLHEKEGRNRAFCLIVSPWKKQTVFM